jgi:hypothetical protein
MWHLSLRQNGCLTLYTSLIVRIITGFRRGENPAVHCGTRGLVGD